MPEWITITHAEALALIRANPHWEHNFTGSCDMRNYNDFSTGQVWPESMRLRRSEGWGSKTDDPWEVMHPLPPKGINRALNDGVLIDINGSKS
jgi:hypothetical protein